MSDKTSDSGDLADKMALENAKEQSTISSEPESKSHMTDSTANHRAESPLSDGASASTDSPVSESPRKGSSAIAWLALILVLGVVAAAAWLVQQGMARESQLGQRLSSLEASAGSAAVDSDTTVQLGSLEAKFTEQLQGGLTQVTSELAAQDERQAKLVEALDTQLRQQQEKLASYSANDHDSWLRAEAQYLLRLANQRLIMAGDVVSASALLASADNILRELDDPTLHSVRAALAAEQAALRAVPKIDVEGIYLRLSALVEQADKLVIFQMQEVEEQPRPEASDDWQVRLEQGYEEAVKKLSDYVIIRRRDVPMQALMDPQWEGLVRQNLRMLLEQAQVALLSGNQTLYRESLERSQHWVAQFFDTDESASRAMAREITQLESQLIAVDLPDLGRSLGALDTAVKNRLQQRGAN